MNDEELNRRFEKADERWRIVDERLLEMGERRHEMAERQLQTDERLEDIKENAIRMERRMIRVENVLKLAIRAGRRERREWREKYAALVDAQMRSEAKLTRTEEAVNRLVEFQAHSDKRLDALIDIVREDRERSGGRPRRDDTGDDGV